ncbi:unnamed protein product [Gulo gulo]|uniref:Uncharacterized protein n=1 Tax=Gulo gulo TaxID=48420 RepID=A0A9X9Q0X7_GULGU|nr:unnamed protein product [Gulo gulo]
MVCSFEPCPCWVPPGLFLQQGHAQHVLRWNGVGPAGTVHGRPQEVNELFPVGEEVFPCILRGAQLQVAGAAGGELEAQLLFLTVVNGDPHKLQGKEPGELQGPRSLAAFSLGGLAPAGVLFTAGVRAGQQQDVWQREEGAGGCDGHRHHSDSVVHVHDFSPFANLDKVAFKNRCVLEYVIFPLAQLSLEFPHGGVEHAQPGGAVGCVIRWQRRGVHDDFVSQTAGPARGGGWSGGWSLELLLLGLLGLAERATLLLRHSAGSVAGVPNPPKRTHRPQATSPRFGSEPPRDGGQGGGLGG